MKNDHIIFDLTNPNCKYKGVLFSEVDFIKMMKNDSYPFPPPPGDYIAGVMGIIWVDENGFWNFKARIKFPSGSKQIISFEPKKESSETQILQEFYMKFPQINKHWYKNPCESVDGILNILKDSDMIEYSKIEVNDTLNKPQKIDTF